MTTKRQPEKVSADDLVFAGAVRRRREVRGWSQKRLADEVGLSTMTISRIEAGHRGVSRGEAVDLAHAFETTVEQMAEPMSAAAMRVGWRAWEIMDGLDRDITALLGRALDEASALPDILGEAVLEIDNLVRLDDAVDEYYARNLMQAVYVIEEIPALVDSIWPSLRDFGSGLNIPVLNRRPYRVDQRDSNPSLQTVLERVDEVLARGQKR